MLIKPVYGRQFFDADKDGGGGGGGGGGKDDSDKGDKGGDDSKSKADDKDGKGKEKEFVPITSQEDLDAALTRRMAQQERALRKSITDEVKAQLKADADSDAAAKQGDFKKLYEDLQTKYADLEGKLKTSERSSLVSRIAAKHKLPEDLHSRLVGDDESALDEDAAKLAKLIGPPKAADTDTGKKSTSKTPTDNGATKTHTQDGKLPSYSFLPAGAVAVPPE